MDALSPERARARRAWAVSLGVAAVAAVFALGICGPSARGAERAPTAPAATAPPKPHLLIFAAASLADVLEEVDGAFTAQSGIAVAGSYAASSVLAKQIEAGAGADVFFSADVDWVDYLDERGLLKRGSRREVLGNQLVLVAPAGSSLRLEVTPHLDLAAALGSGGRLAVADPDSVPAGVYARAALMKLGLWERFAGRLARGENVRTALAYVARGEAPLGIVYHTDALAEKRVREVGVFPDDTHPPIRYVVALVAPSRPEAAQLVEFLGGERARAVFVRYGFVPLRPPAAVSPVR